jgi:hypothetical protein
VIRAVAAGDLAGAFEEAKRLNAEVMAISNAASQAVVADLTTEASPQA